MQNLLILNDEVFMYLIHPPIPTELFRIGNFAIRWYSLMYIFGFLFFYWWTKHECKKNRISFAKDNKLSTNSEFLSDFLFYIMLGVLLGGRLGYVFFYNFEYYFSENPMSIFKVWEGGMSFHGAFIGSYIGAFVALKIRHSILKPFSLLELSDIVLVSVPMGLAFGRFGNFINGELYGRPTTIPWGMVFPRRPELGHLGATVLPLEKAQAFIDATQLQLIPNITEYTINNATYIQVPRHPSQLYHILLEGLLTLTVQMILYYKIPQSRYKGFLTATFLILYGISRIITEFFREPDIQIGFIAGNWLTAGMILTFPMIVTGIILLIYALKNKKPNIIRN